jgi:hypothetical protein
MRWLRRPARRPGSVGSDVATPIEDLDPTTLDVLEDDADGRLQGLPRWPEDDSLLEASYARPGPDGTGSEGIWTAIAHS